MELAFRSLRLQRILEDQKEIKRTFGSDSQRKIMQQMSLLNSAETMQDVFSGIGGWHELEGNRKGQCAGDAGGGLRIIVKPNPPVPMKPDRGTDWTKVKSVQVVEVGDYH